MKKIAAFDIGSNAIRMAVGEVDLEGTFRLEKRFRVPLRLGTEVFSEGILSPSTRESLVKNFAKFQKVMEENHVQFYRCVGTSALRNARNAAEVIEEILEKTGIRVEIIHGQVEAKLIRRSLESKIDLNRRNYLLFDIGGGSTELSLLERGRLRGSLSLPMGAVRLLEEGKRAAQQRGVPPERAYREYLSSLDEDLKNFFVLHYNLPKSIRVIGTGGNFKRLGRLRKKIYHKKNIDFIYPDEVAGIREALEETSPLNRQKKFGLRHDRADVIIPAIYIIENVMSFIPMRIIYTPDRGLLHGVFLELRESLLEGEAEEFSKVIACP